MAIDNAAQVATNQATGITACGHPQRCIAVDHRAVIGADECAHIAEPVDKTARQPYISNDSRPTGVAKQANVQVPGCIDNQT